MGNQDSKQWKGGKQDIPAGKLKAEGGISKQKLNSHCLPLDLWTATQLRKVNPEWTLASSAAQPLWGSQQGAEHKAALVLVHLPEPQLMEKAGVMKVTDAEESL